MRCEKEEHQIEGVRERIMVQFVREMLFVEYVVEGIITDKCHPRNLAKMNIFNLLFF